MNCLYFCFTVDFGFCCTCGGALSLRGALIENTANGYPVKRWANAEEIARAVMFLASDEATIIVATDFDATGGYTRKVISHGKHLSRNLQFFGARNL